MYLIADASRLSWMTINFWGSLRAPICFPISGFTCPSRPRRRNENLLSVAHASRLRLISARKPEACATLSHEKRTGLGDTRHSRWPGAGSHSRLGNDADLRHVYLRAGKPGKTHRLRLRVLDQSK